MKKILKIAAALEWVVGHFTLSNGKSFNAEYFNELKEKGLAFDAPN